MARNRNIAMDRDPVLVIGLGRFGLALAKSLEALEHEVLAVDSRPEVVQRHANTLTHVVEADSTDIDAMKQIGAHDFGRAVVGMGDQLEVSILTTAVLSDLQIPEIWAKAVSSEHGRILERVGAHHVVYPERAMGERVAHLVTGKMIDFIEFDDGFAIVKTRPPREAVNRTLAESALRARHKITVVGTKRPGSDFVYARPETVVREGDLLIVCGDTTDCERFAATT
ncbi:MAG TPA: TrkA family potassium uptake protein [Jiangellales bacterium]|jgi:trk system potassium uptake protein|nr:TrkA family potassium uptake protein [Jiangellales bacterium]